MHNTRMSGASQVGGSAPSYAQEHRPLPPSVKQKKAKSTFTSCKEFPLPGEDYNPVEPPPEETDAGERTSRRSKVSAQNKLESLKAGIAAAAGVASTAPPFKLSSVRTRAPRIPPPRTTSRAFGLSEAPTYYPTADEFKDPMEYIRRIGDEGGAKNWGICKVVPPEGWEPPFVLNTETFTFRTRLMELNSIEAKSRAKINFLDQLYMFHQQQGDQKVAIPMIDHVPVDLWQLRREINEAGGFNTVTKNREWPEITELLGFDSAHWQVIKSAYVKIIFPFTEFSTHARKSPSASPLTPLSPGGSPFTPKFEDSPIEATNSELWTKPRRLGTNTSNNAPFRPSPIAGPSLYPGGDEQEDDRGPPSSKPLSNGVKRKLEFGEDGDNEASEGNGVEEVVVVQRPSSVSPRGDKLVVEASEQTRAPLGLPPPTTPLGPPKVPTHQKGEVCEICLKGNDAKKILLCDGCDGGFHIYCLSPPLESVPKNEDWYCNTCLFDTGADYGFDEGEDHTLATFKRRNDAFTDWWFKRHPPEPLDDAEADTTFPNGMTRIIGGVPVSEHDVEREFWRLVESQTETVEVEYGADVHSTGQGSGAPTLETHPLDPYAVDPWNLNNMPILPGSILRYIKSNISGMTVPWIYVGMLFSAFCWHNEDHYTCSVNYMHWGETKTWYGIPADDAEKFEEAMKSEAPDLFEQQPSLLFQLVTMMNPGRVRKAGVKIFALDQRANEFVITFPKAYHAGFNHGLNYNEAVNFALPDWLPMGSDSVLKYQEHMKAPVFSHDELLVTIYTHSHTIQTAMWLQESFQLMTSREIEKRDRLRSALQIQEDLVEHDRSEEEEYQCCNCHAYCYLAQVTCSCTKRVSCLDHATSLCNCELNSRVLRLRFSDQKIVQMRDDVVAKAAIPVNWRTRFQKLLADSPRPSLRSLRALVADAERIQYPLPELVALKAFVEKGSEWVAEASAFLLRKSHSRRPAAEKINGRTSRTAGPEVIVEKQKAIEDPSQFSSVDDVEDLLRRVERLGFDSPEIHQLQTLLRAIYDFQKRAAALLSRVDDSMKTLAECEALLARGSSLTVDLPETVQLDKAIKRMKWTEEIESVEDLYLSIKAVDKWLDTAESCGVSDSHPMLTELRAKKALGMVWKARAVNALNPPAGQYTDLAVFEDLENRPDGTPVDSEFMLNIQGTRNRATEWQRQSRELLNSAAISGHLTMADARRIVKRTEARGRLLVRIPEVEVLKAELKIYDTWVKDTVSWFASPQDFDKKLSLILRSIKQRTNPHDDEPEAVTDEAQHSQYILRYQQHHPTPPPLQPVDRTFGTSEHHSESSGEEEGVEAVMGNDPSAPSDTLKPFTCVCRTPQVILMLRCKGCSHLYHPECVGLNTRNIRDFNEYRCFLCDTKLQGLQRMEKHTLSDISKLYALGSLPFKYIPTELKYINDIQRHAEYLIQLVSPHLSIPSAVLRNPGSPTQIQYIHHYLRKVESLELDIHLRGPMGEQVEMRSALLNTSNFLLRPSSNITESKKRKESPSFQLPAPQKLRQDAHPSQPSTSAASPSERKFTLDELKTLMLKNNLDEAFIDGLLRKM